MRDPQGLIGGGVPVTTGVETPLVGDLVRPPAPARRQPLDPVLSTPAAPVEQPPTTPTPGEGGTPKLAFSTQTLRFSARQNDPNPAPVDVQVTNTGTGTLAFSAVSALPGRVYVYPPSGTAPGVVRITALTTGLPVGTSTVLVSVTAPGASNSPQLLTITLEILSPTTVPPDGPTTPTVAPIGKALWLGYFKVAGRDVPGQPTASAGAAVTATAGAGNVAVVLGGSDDFADTQDWRTSQTLAADALNGIGAKIICRCHEDDVANLASRWGMVAALYLAAESGGLADALLTIERRIREVRTRIDALQLTNKPVLVYFNGGQIDDPGWYLPDGVDWVGVEAYADPSMQVSSEAAQNYLRTVVPPRFAKIPAAARLLLIGQGYDRNGLWTNAVSLAGLQAVYAELVGRDARVDGILWFAYLRAGGTSSYPDVRAWHTAIARAAVRGFPASVDAVPNFRALGAVTRCDCTAIEGWAFNPSARDLAVQVQVFLGDRHTYAPPNQNQNRVVQLAANLSHTDPSLTTAFDVSATTRGGPAHWFRAATPAALKDGRSKTVYVYGVSMLDGQQTVLASSPTAITCSPGTVTPTPGNEGLLTMIRADFDSGRFSGITEAPGRSGAAQDAFLDLCVQKRYQWVIWCPVSAGDDPPGATPYDGFETRSALYQWVDKCAARKIVSIVVPFQGAPGSWAIIQAKQYTNEWARANFGAWCKHFWDRTGGYFFPMLGFEWNKKFANPDPDYRGPGELWGFNGASSYWARAAKQAVPQMPVLLHLLPGAPGPTPGEGGRPWTPDDFWRGKYLDDGKCWIDGLGFQVELDSPHDDAYYRAQARANLAVLHGAGKKCYAAEYVRPGTSFPGSANVGESRAEQIARIMLAEGVDGFMNGGPLTWP